jgi:hypothetical protein
MMPASGPFAATAGVEAAPKIASESAEPLGIRG